METPKIINQSYGTSFLFIFIRYEYEMNEIYVYLRQGEKLKLVYINFRLYDRLQFKNRAIKFYKIETLFIPHYLWLAVD